MGNPSEVPKMKKESSTEGTAYSKVESYIKDGMLKDDKFGTWLVENQYKFDPTQQRFFEKRSVEDLVENIKKGMPLVTLEYFEMLAGLGYKQNVPDLRKIILEISGRNFTKEKYLTKDELENFFDQEHQSRNDKLELAFGEDPNSYTREEKTRERQSIDEWLTAGQQLTFSDNGLVGIGVIEKEIEYFVGYRQNIIEAIQEASRGSSSEAAGGFRQELTNIDKKLSLYRSVRDTLYKRELEK